MDRSSLSAADGPWSPEIWVRGERNAALGTIDVKIFGERNTATNALKQLIERNSRSRVLPSVAKEIDTTFDRAMRLISKLPFKTTLREAYIDRVFRAKSPRLAWKHAATNFSDLSAFRDCAVLLTTRHPASWLVAFHRRPYHALGAVPAKFATFLTTRQKTVWRDNLQRRSMTPIELWNAKMASYVSFSKRLEATGTVCRWVRFEDFVRDQSSVFESLRDILSEPAETVSVIAKSTKERSKDFRYYRDYYGNAVWLRDIDELSRNLIDQRLDWQLAAELGYRPLAELAPEPTLSSNASLMPLS